MADIIPSTDTEFDAWQRNLVTYITTRFDNSVTDAEAVRNLLKHQKLWVADHAASTTARVVASGARQAKDNTREAYEVLIRELIQRLEAVGGLDMSDLRPPGTSAGLPPQR